MAFDSPYDSEAAKPPISLHPAFPAIVALWFAALLGIGSLVLPVVLLEQVLSASGTASLVPAAQPPLGLTARGLIALAAALAGAGLGVAVARRVARSHAPEPESRVAKLAGGLRRPVSVKDELGGDGVRAVVNGEGLPLNRRRALAISEDDRPSDFLYQIPLPGSDPDAPAPFAAAPIVNALPDDEPLELCELAAEPADEDDAMTDSRESRSEWPSHQHLPASEVETIEELDARKNLGGPRGAEPLPFSAPSLTRRAVVVEFEPPAAPEEPEPEPEVAESDAPLETVAASPESAEPEPETRADWASAPLESLGLVQLVQRLGSTIERRREWMAQIAPAPESVPAPAPVSFAQPELEPAPAEEAVQAMAAFFAPDSADLEPDSHPLAASAEGAGDRQPTAFEAPPEPLAMLPRVLQPFAADNEDEEENEDDAVADFSLPLRAGAAAASSFAEPGGGFEDDGGEAMPNIADAEPDTGGYSSLLGMSNPFAAPKNEFVRIDEPDDDSDLVEPAVVFPGEREPARFAEAATAAPARLFDPPGKPGAPAVSSVPVPADTDAALRAALATLQRMSGAA